MNIKGTTVVFLYRGYTIVDSTPTHVQPPLVVDAGIAILQPVLYAVRGKGTVPIIESHGKPVRLFLLDIFKEVPEFSVAAAFKVNHVAVKTVVLGNLNKLVRYNKVPLLVLLRELLKKYITKLGIPPWNKNSTSSGDAVAVGSISASSSS